MGSVLAEVVMQLTGHLCQSCAMPMSKSEDFGTNADGSKCDDYCTFCFQNGNFTDEGTTLEQKIDNVVRIAVTQLKMPEAQARALAEETIPTLKRWQR
jgi:hypothetical protein